MSYSRSYSRTVTQHYSQSVTISYPASQNGGSTTEVISGTVEVPINIDIHVDTDNFDDNVDRCKNSVSTLNAAVVATTAEEIRAKQEASTQIGRTIVKGFFDYISSELSQLKSELSTRCDSILTALFEQKKACEDKSLQMEGDYKRIATRYLKLFTDLDNELSSRIKSVDKSAFALNRDIMSSSSRATDTTLLGVSTIISAETAQLEAILAASSIKNRAQRLIGKTSGFLAGTYALQKMMNDMLIEGCSNSLSMLPIIYVETHGENNSVKSETYGQSALPLASVSDLGAKLKNRFQEKSLSWRGVGSAESEQIDSYFNNELSLAQLDSRIAKMMIDLKEKNVINVVKNV